jgi:hypothetical protein
VALLAYQHFRWQMPLRHFFAMFFGHVLPGWLAATIGCWLFYRVAQLCRRRPHA